jgi:ABC-type glycerol-3-phosphate transport system substrate-binding protein
MKKLVLICALLLSSAIVLTACGSSAPKAGNTAANDSTEQTQDSTEAVQAASTGNSQGSGYDDIKSKDIPADILPTSFRFQRKAATKL